uniref:Cauli_VI domain-containing protein n=1 Tax=Haemonchus placei TaxID=6290 RepID=A0A0N4W038_HAEPC
LVPMDCSSRLHRGTPLTASRHGIESTSSDSPKSNRAAEAVIAALAMLNCNNNCGGVYTNWATKAGEDLQIVGLVGHVFPSPENIKKAVKKI